MQQTPETDHDTDALSESALVEALRNIEAHICRAEQERAKLEQMIGRAREEERLLRRLIDIRRNPPQVDGHDPTPGPTVPSEGAGTPTTGANRAIPAVEAVVHELAAAARPLHISELMRILFERKVKIPGAGVQANLIAHLRRDPRVVRPSRGMYGLSDWGLEAMPTSAYRRRRKKHLRSTVKKGESD